MKKIITLAFLLISCISYEQGKKITLRVSGSGGLTTEVDPFYSASTWFTTTNNYANWDAAYGWGNHSLAGYLTSFTELDPVWVADKPDYLTTSIAGSTYSVLGHTHAYSSLTGLPTLFTQSDADALYSVLAHSHTFASLTSKPTTIAGYGITDFNSLGDARWSLLAHTHTFSSLTSKPTTLGGYGITDGLTSSDLTPYLLSSTASSTYAPISNPSFTGTPAAPTASAGTNTTQLATTAFVQTAIAGTIPDRTGSVISFDQSAIYNTAASPATGNVTFDLTGAVANTEVVLYHNSTTPTFPAIASVVGSYYSGNLNEIRLIYRSSTEVDVVIRNSNPSGYVNPETIYTIGSDATTTGTTGTTIGMNITIAAGGTYIIEGIMGVSCDNTGGIVFGTGHTVTPAAVSMLFIGPVASTVAGAPDANGMLTTSTSLVSGYNAVFTQASNDAFCKVNGTSYVTVFGKVTGGASTSTMTILFASKTSTQLTTIRNIRTFIKVTKTN